MTLAEIRIGQPVLVRAAAFRGREFPGKVSFIAPIVEPGRINARGQRSLTDVDVVEVLVDLAEAGPLAVGMKVDVYFHHENTPRWACGDGEQNAGSCRRATAASTTQAPNPVAWAKARASSG